MAQSGHANALSRCPLSGRATSPSRQAASSKKIPRVIKRHHNHDRPRKKSIEFSRLRLAVFSFASGLFSKICRLVFLRIACFGS
jgi:hypothetical protein